MADVTPQAPWVSEVLDVWFDELGERRWFAKDAALDDAIRARFGALQARLLASGGASVAGARATLAAVIVLDQFSRNIHRGQATAFAGDASARRLAVRLTAALGNEDWTRYALAHQRIIERFGRFPHRNAALGRHSSAEELALLEQATGGF